MDCDCRECRREAAWAKLAQAPLWLIGLVCFLVAGLITTLVWAIH
jgi:hypothetical protein